MSTPSAPRASGSRRGSIDGLGTRHPIGLQLPAVYADDELAQRFTAGLDDVIAPLLNVLDCMDSYFRPSLAPEDFTAWLGGWVGAETEPDTSLPLLRESVASAAGLHRLRGTRRGLAEAVRLAFGTVPEITESGGADWSARPLGAFPGDPRPHLLVVLRVDDPATIDVQRLDELVRAARPAHIPCTVQVTAKRGPEK
ncbi:phage tail protein [Streptacidiphilus sp. P02-A3a]|uniref:phage tail protein n=1 Tax=Streptacidiphilus sp. P02-A3a TaxID=2704468 RepID=UPI0015FD9B5E|nr:phage tail protein [Streptacidiphilus sp. P02-A3a]QMU71003.1 phage tail protein [Streptacidiphilus sp. P02-A3a]